MIRPATQQPDGVGELEGKDDVGVVDLAPAELRLEGRLEDAEHLPIDVVDRRREEQQAADDPAEVADADARREPSRPPGDSVSLSDSAGSST